MLWQSKHWKTIKQNYSKTPFFYLYKDFFKDIYLARKWCNLSELNQYLICSISKDFLGIKTDFKDSREYCLSGNKFERLFELLKKSSADRYVSGPSAQEYIDVSYLVNAGITLIWKNYFGYPEYIQHSPPFEHCVSILDLLFNVGPDASWYIWGWREGFPKP